MALYHRYRMELSAAEKQKHMFKGLCNIRENDLIVNSIKKMFDFELEVSDLEKDLFSVQEKMELMAQSTIMLPQC